jgi:gluconolactonase
LNDPGSPISLLLSGYGAVEAPIPDEPADGLYFSDPIDGGVYWRSAEGTVRTVIPKRRGVGGVCLHQQGGIVVSGRDIVHVTDGESRTLLGREHYAKLGLDPATSFNEIYADPQGRVLAGAVWGGAFDENVKGALVLVTAAGEGEVIYQGVVGANGIAFDPQRGRLYQCSTYDKRIIVSTPHGSSYRKVGEISTEAVAGYPDGLKLDDEGDLWMACHRSNAVVRLDPSGAVVERIELPSDDVTSLCFVARPAPALLVTTAANSERPELRGCLFSIPTTRRGAPLHRVSI